MQTEEEFQKTLRFIRECVDRTIDKNLRDKLIRGPPSQEKKKQQYKNNKF